MKHKWYIICFCIIFSISLMACGKKLAPTVAEKPSDWNAISQVVIENEKITLTKGDILNVDAWNGSIEKDATVSLNEKNYKEMPVICGSITIGSSAEDVIKQFGIEDGYAICNREIDPYGDGSTDVVEETYKNLAFWEKEHVLNAFLQFAYKKNSDGTLEMLSAEELKKALEKDTSETDIIMYSIGVDGLDGDENEISTKRVASIRITYL